MEIAYLSVTCHMDEMFNGHFIIKVGDWIMVRKRLCFTGSVQGVGFRYRAYHAAMGLGLTGWVQNRWDGSVLMEVQGSEAEIDRLIATINSGRFVYIDNIDCQNIPIDEEEKSFKIKYSE